MGEITPEQQRNRERLYDISTQLQRGGISPTRSLFMAMKVMDTQLESRIEREKLSEANRTEMSDLLPLVMAGELTPEEAGDAFRKNYIDFCRRNGIDPNKYKPFDQQERRLIMGVPVLKKEVT